MVTPARDTKPAWAVAYLVGGLAFVAGCALLLWWLALAGVAWMVVVGVTWAVLTRSPRIRRYW